jgi:hypothetical protein
VATHKVERHRPTERVPEQVDAPGPVGQRFDGARDGIGEQADAVLDAGSAGFVAPTVSEQVHGEDAPPSREERKRERPLTMVRPDAMQEDERRDALGARAPRVETTHVESGRKGEAPELQYFRIRPTTTPWTLRSPSATQIGFIRSFAGWSLMRPSDSR